MEDERHLIDRVHVLRRDHFVFLQVAEKGDFLFQLGGQVPVRPAEEDVGLDTDLPQLVDAVLGRFGLELASGTQIGYQRDMDVQDVLPPHVVGKLTDGLQERQALDVAHRPPDLADHDVHPVRQRSDGSFDFIRDVRYHLDRPAQIIPSALLHDDVVVDAPGREVIAPPDGHGREPLVVPEVEVGLRAVLRHVDLAVLVGIHRPRVNIDIGVDF